MESKAKLFEHAIHPMLIVFPLGLLAMSVVGVLLAPVTAWLGGELVERLGVDVAEGANLDAPLSLSHQPARATAGTARGMRS
jgi:uncharacterized membrane protein